MRTVAGFLFAAAFVGLTLIASVIFNSGLPTPLAALFGAPFAVSAVLSAWVVLEKVSDAVATRREARRNRENAYFEA